MGAEGRHPQRNGYTNTSNIPCKKREHAVTKGEHRAVLDFVTHRTMTHSIVQKLISAAILAGLVAAFMGASSTVGTTGSEDGFNAVQSVTNLAPAVNSVLHR